MGTDIITIEGVEALHGAAHRVMPDRIETGNSWSPLPLLEEKSN